MQKKQAFSQGAFPAASREEFYSKFVWYYGAPPPRSAPSHLLSPIWNKSLRNRKYAPLDSSELSAYSGSLSRRACLYRLSATGFPALLRIFFLHTFLPYSHSAAQIHPKALLFSSNTASAFLHSSAYTQSCPVSWKNSSYPCRFPVLYPQIS